MKGNYQIRELREDEKIILEDLLYEAIFQLPDNNPLPKDTIYTPEIYNYIENFGNKKDDHCLIAESEGTIMGGVWIRLLNKPIRGYGNIDNETPEFAISLFPPYRNQGIGTKLMQAMISYMKEKGYTRTSLSVNKNNYAFRMYLKLGFEIIKEQEEDYLMILNFRNK